jgi:hypothetical protein
MNSQTEPSTRGGQSPGPAKLPPPEVGPARNPQPGQEPGSRDPLVHYEMFAATVDAALTVDGMSDMMRLLRITQAHVRLTKAVR